MCAECISTDWTHMKSSFDSAFSKHKFSLVWAGRPKYNHTLLQKMHVLKTSHLFWVEYGAKLLREKRIQVDFHDKLNSNMKRDGSTEAFHRYACLVLWKLKNFKEGTKDTCPKMSLFDTARNLLSDMRGQQVNHELWIFSTINLSTYH